MAHLTVFTDDGKSVLDVDGITEWITDSAEDTNDTRIEYTERSGKHRCAETNMYYLITDDVEE